MATTNNHLLASLVFVTVFDHLLIFLRCVLLQFKCWHLIPVNPAHGAFGQHHHQNCGNNQNSDITTEFIYTRESDGTVLSGGTDPISGLPLGIILDSEDVRLTVRYTRATGTWPDLLNTYGINAIEEDGGAGQLEYRQLSSIVNPEADNPLEGISGTLLDVTLVSPTVIECACIIKPTKLLPANRYKITGRLGCK